MLAADDVPSANDAEIQALSSDIKGLPCQAWSRLLVVFFRTVSNFNTLKTLTRAVLFWCFHNQLNSDMDYSIFNVSKSVTWGRVCVCFYVQSTSLKWGCDLLHVYYTHTGDLGL